MADPIRPDGETIYHPTQPVVAISLSISGPYEEIPYLWCDRLRVACAPEIDEAILSWRFGKGWKEQDRGVDPLVYTPWDNLNGKFVRIELIDFVSGTVGFWYGIIEVDAKDAHGDSPEPQGMQTFVAYGLLRLLERQTVKESLVEPNRFPPDPHAIQRGLEFNADTGGLFNSRGNRSSQRYSLQGLGFCYVFSDRRRRQDLWNAWHAAEYLLTVHQPVDVNGFTICDWILSGDASALTWYEISLPTDMRNVKELLDALINRRRGVGYYVTFDGVLKRAYVNVFNFLDTALTMPSQKVVGPNPKQYTLDFSTGFDVERAEIVDVASQRYDLVVALGAFKTSTATLSFYDPSVTASIDGELIPDWTQADEDLYLEAAETDPTVDGVEEMNARYRANDSLRHVYCRFTIENGWREAVPYTIGATQLNYIAPPTDKTTGAYVDIVQPNIPGEGIWTRGLTIEQRLVLRDRFDYSGNKLDAWVDPPGFNTSAAGEPEFLPPLVFIATEFLDPNHPDLQDVTRWEYVDKLNAANERSWACHVQVLDSAPSLDIVVRGKPQHFLSSTWFVTAATGPYSADHDPLANGGLEWKHLRATVTLRLDERLTAQSRIFGGSIIGQPERVLHISVPEMRRDYVLPGTWVGLDSDGYPIQTDNGGLVRDDFAKLADIARSAATWYGKPRQTLDLTFKQVRVGKFELGWLITEIQAPYNRQLNTVVTAIAWDFASKVPKMTVQTSYAELDFTGAT